MQARTIMHGKTSTISHTQNELFSVFDSPISVMRYHSLVIEENSLQDCFEVLARAEDDLEIMAIKHSDYPLYGLQFHPESIGTEQGTLLMKGFIDTLN